VGEQLVYLSSVSTLTLNIPAQLMQRMFRNAAASTITLNAPNLTSIGGYMFENVGCRTITLNTPNLTSIGEYMFKNVVSARTKTLTLGSNYFISPPTNSEPLYTQTQTLYVKNDLLAQYKANNQWERIPTIVGI
jgi:hypothetical protein